MMTARVRDKSLIRSCTRDTRAPGGAEILLEEQNLQEEQRNSRRSREPPGGAEKLQKELRSSRRCKEPPRGAENLQEEQRSFRRSREAPEHLGLICSSETAGASAAIKLTADDWILF